MKKILPPLVIMLLIRLGGGTLLASGNINYQLSNSRLCNGDTAMLSFNGISNATIFPAFSVTWIDTCHALLYPDFTTTYLLTGQNGQGQMDTAQIVITVSQPPIAFASIAAPVLCNGNSATVLVGATSGTPPYSGTGYFNTDAGTYHFLVTDSLGCQSADSIVITEPTALNLDIQTGNIRCFGGNDTVTVIATGGTPPYSGTGVFYAPAGSQRYTVIDSNGCQVSLSVTITQPTPLTIQLFANNIPCNGDSTPVTINAFGGSPAYTGTGTFEEGAGTHYFTVTDIYGCTVNDSVTLVQPTAFQVSINALDSTTICSNDSVLLCATGGFASYRWNNSDTTTCIQTQLAGNYYVTVTDLANCTAQSNVIAVTVNQSPVVSISVNGDTLSVHNQGLLQWYLNNVPIGGATSPVYIAAEPGNYTVQVSDSIGCFSFSNPVLITAITNVEANKIEVYPNPLASGHWKLTATNDLIGSEITLLDERGQNIYTGKITSRETEIPANFGAGIYLLQITTPTNLLVRKLVKM